MNVVVQDGKLLVTRTFSQPKHVPAGRPVFCPECGEPPSGTLEILDSVAEITIDSAADAGTIEYSGYTNTDCLWDSQETVYLNGCAVMYCKGPQAHLFTHEDIAQIA